MALINCPDCGTEVSDAAAACPKCARPIAIEAASELRPSTAKSSSERARSPAVFTVTLSSFVLIVLAIAAAVWFVPAMEIGQNLEARCQVNGTGAGTCQFTNTGWTPGAQCVDVSLHNKQGGAVHSGAVCSGRVWPNDTTEKNVMIEIGNTCNNALGVPDFSGVCTMDVNNANSNAVGDAPSSTDADPPAADTGASSAASTGIADAAASADSAPAPMEATPVEASSSPAPPSSVAISPPATSTSIPASQSPTAVVSGPSFDCSKVSDSTDLTICSNDELSQLDRQMAALYVARAQSTDDTTMRDKQRAWLHDRNQCGADVPCLRQEYAARIQQLQQ